MFFHFYRRLASLEIFPASLRNASPCFSLVVSLLVFWGCPFENKLIFHPDYRIHRTPEDVGLAFDDLFFDTKDGVRLNGWYIPYRGATKTLVWFHGNAGNISHRVGNIRLLHHRLKINIFIFDYRGYGRSTGSISEQGTYMDGAAAVEYLRIRYAVEPTRMVLFGRSLGAAVAAEMANHVQSAALILESPFSSVGEIAHELIPFLPLGPLLKTRYDTVAKVRGIKSPLLVLHGDKDEVVPFSQGIKVFEAAPQPKTFYRIVGAGHNDAYLVGGEPYFQVLKKHIEFADSAER
jgi:hypothetical protein